MEITLSKDQRINLNQVWSDMALEQSVNRDSKTKGGIVGITLQKNALDRWFLTAHVRAAVTSAIREICSISNDDEQVSELNHKEIGKKQRCRDQRDVQSMLTTVVEQMVNPFEGSDVKELPNIATGVIASVEVAQGILEAKKDGQKAVESYVNDRLMSNKVGVFAPLEKAWRKTFASLRKRVSKAKGDKVTSINADRAFFSRLLIIANTRTLNLKEVFEYELSAVPYSIAYPDGSLRKGTKSKLLLELEKETVVSENLSSSEEQETTWVIDGMAMLQMVKFSSCTRFGELNDKLLKVALQLLLQYNNCVRLDVVFDFYGKEDSIKAFERARRKAADPLMINISGPQTTIPKQWSKFMSSSKNKSVLTAFLCKDWTEKCPALIPEGKQFVIGGGFQDNNFAVCIDRQGATPIPELFSNQEEADTRMLLHANHCKEICDRIVIWSPDTDVAVLCVHFQEKIGKEVWFKTGVKDKSRFIPTHEISRSIGTALSEALPAFHTLTGCDSTSSLAKIGKAKAWKFLKINAEEFCELLELGNSEHVSTETLENVRLFLCMLYDTKTETSDINYLCYHLSCRKQAKNEDLPPTEDSLDLHTMRCNFQTLIWKNILVPMFDILSPVDKAGT